MYDEYGDPTDDTVLGWAEHNAHADDAQQILDQERADAEQSLGTWWSHEQVIDAADCATCGAHTGQPCHPVEHCNGTLIHHSDAVVTPHPGRFHRVGQPCADICDDCPRSTHVEWTTPDIDGITVRLDGADDELIVLWESGYTTSETIRTLCQALDREIDSGNVIDGVAAVYLRDANTLVAARIRYQHDAETITVEVSRDLATGPVSIALGSLPGPVDWATIRPIGQPDPDQQR